MSGGIFFKLGQGWGRLPLAWKIAVGLVFLFGLSRCVTSESSSSTPSPSASSAPVVDAAAQARIQQLRDAATADCKASMPERLTNYEKLMKQKAYIEAKGAFANCPATLKDAELQEKVLQAQRLELVTSIDDTKASATQRIAAIAALKRLDPAAAERFMALSAQLEKAEAKQVADAEKRQAAAAKAKKRSEGVSLGMSPEDVLASSWGKPESINRTTTQFGTREQWVYGGRNYLYFENGKLTSIQN